ncbi:MAG: bifunctional methionine sulfoxide reductase B/A protein [Synergistaceae bacterium]|jgi:peptide methionine sulfoxide reductase msrA/msrB|nr:bifunctional methionine sulfoxide reductase B/A protein [Synergistaceae bacterium]
MPEWKIIRPMPPLGEAERRVLLESETEQPNSGIYENFYENGMYLCRQCGLSLFRSESKFGCECGWPAFDDSIPDAVEKRADPDGVRTEIVCANCCGHLGHYFEGENFTSGNRRHCVNSLSISHIPSLKAIFAGGCFWGVEDIFRNVPGVLLVTPGYSGGHTVSPTYREVCEGKTGCIESVLIDYDRDATDYRMLLHFFFEIHDPTQIDRQGPDTGLQYRSVVFYFDKEQKRIARETIDKLRSLGIEAATRVEPVRSFYPAEDYHRRYFEKHPEGRVQTCHVRKPIDWN